MYVKLCVKNMKFSDAEKRNVSKRKNRPVEATTNKRWSDKQKLETVQTYFMLGGNLTLVGKTLGIPYPHPTGVEAQRVVAQPGR